LIALPFTLRNHLHVMILTTGVTIFGCSAQPESDGKASLSCGKTSLPDSTFVIEPLHSTGTDFSCGAFRGDLPGPFQVQFRVYEIIKPGGNLPGGGGSEGDAEAQGLQSETVRVPKSGVAFYPVLSSMAQIIMSAARTTSEFQVDPSLFNLNGDTSKCEISPYQYLGIVTPSTEWCSDSSGIMTYEFWVNCNGSSIAFDASVVAGGIKVESSYRFSVAGGI